MFFFGSFITESRVAKCNSVRNGTVSSPLTKLHVPNAKYDRKAEDITEYLACHSTPPCSTMLALVVDLVPLGG